MPIFEVLRGGSASALRIRLQSGEEIKCETDAMVSKSGSVELGARADGGLLSGVARVFFTGESFFLQTFRGTAPNGEVLVAPEEQGDVEVIELGLPGARALEVLVMSGAFLCAEASVSVDTRVQGVKRTLFSGVGLFLMRCSGRGRLALACLGSCIQYTLAPGERRQVDNGHLVAWDATMEYEVGMAVPSVFGSLASGEGMLCTFTGPGSVWVQTHKPRQGKEPQRPAGGAGSLIGRCLSYLMFFIIFGFIVYMTVFGEGGRSKQVKKVRHREF
mmetsp:Transcript_19509/g.44376  ORF Transcript_19509/g.44376 Transcript_19509/m.44376 type:complete len:274 (-) Transcript_19509:81-902(-)